MNPLLTAILPIVGDVIKKVVPDKAKQQEAIQELESKLADNEQQLLLGQQEINKIDAKSGKWYQAGWRPAIGWVCVLALSVQFVFNPIIDTIGDSTGWFDFTPPKIDMGTIMPLILGMLGMGGLRTYDKKNGLHLK